MRRAASTIEEAARRIGQYRWVEMRLFETLGGWVPAVPELDVKLAIAAQAPHHAWHAELWYERLPELAGMDRDQLTRPAGGMVAVLDALAEPAAPDRTIEKLVGVYRVLVPRLIAAYARHLDAASAVTDGPTIRCLRLVLADERDDWLLGEMLVQSLLGDAAALRRAVDHQARMETLLVEGGRVQGPSDASA